MRQVKQILAVNAIGLVLCVVCSLMARAADIPLTARIVYSRTGPPSATADSESTGPMWSADGSRLLFISQASDLTATSVSSRYPAIYYYNVTNHQIQVVTVSLSPSDPPNGFSRNPVMSGSGQFVVFESDASNLVVNDTNLASDIFLRDMVNGTTTLLSAGLTNGSFNPSVTPDGRVVAFESRLPSATNGSVRSAIYLRDTKSGQLIAISTRAGSGALSDGNSSTPAISADGSKVAFVSDAMDLVTGFSATDSLGELYLYDASTGTNRWLSADAAGFRSMITNASLAKFQCNNPVISADGRFASYKITSSVAWKSLIIRVDLANRTSTVIATNAAGSTRDKADSLGPLISADGRYIVYQSTVEGQQWTSQILRWDSSKNETQVVSTNTISTATNIAFDLRSMSSDGERIAFTLSQNNIADFPNGAPTLGYVRDMISGITLPVPNSTIGATATTTGDVLDVELSADGKKVAVSTQRSDLIPDDYNHAFDILLSDVNSNSVGTAISLRDPSAPRPPSVSWFYAKPCVKLAWTAQTGWTYSVQTKSQLGSATWNDVSTAITFNGTTASLIDPIIDGNDQRYYRVVGRPPQ